MKYVVFILSLLTINCFGQKQLTLTDAEQAMQKSNLLLLAEQYNISAAQAAVIQARIWEHPYINAEINAYNPERDQFFDAGKAGQKAISIEQLIYLGGKKKNEVAVARTNSEIAALQFEDLLRNLKFQLYQDFYSIYFEFQKIALLDTQIDKLDLLVKEFQVQADKNNIALKEVVRLQTLLLSLRNDRSNFQKEIIAHQEEIKLLIAGQEDIIPVVDEAEINKYDLPKVAKEELFDKALQKDPTYLTALKVAESQEFYLRWQRSLAVPDITLGAGYDQRSGAFNDQVNLTLGIPLVLWNRNKGNIRMARATLDQSKLNSEYAKAELQHKIEAAWQVWEEQKKQTTVTSKSVSTNLNLVYKGMLDNFQKRNITFLEFVDFMESYNQSTLQLNEMKKQLIISGIHLNYVTNIEIF